MDYNPELIPWGEVGYATYKRTYARPVKDRTEEWEETVDRIVEACNKQLKCDFNEHDQRDIKRMMMQLKGTVAGRFLWQLGTRSTFSAELCVRCGRRASTSFHVGIRDAYAW